jgi:FkbM family methyltransferase
MLSRQDFSQSVKRLGRRLGVKIERYNEASSHELQLVRMLTVHGVDLVVDVGASSGGYAASLRDHGYRRRILSFEPLRAPYAALEQRARGDDDWAVAPRMALGATGGVSAMNVAANSDSSSLRDMLDRHKEAAPESAYVGVEEVEVRRLDEVRHPFLDASVSPFLKVDTQGYEAEVLKGAQTRLGDFRGVQLEMSLEPLYVGQAGWLELIETVNSQGFRLWSLTPVFCDRQTGKLLQCDGIFFRE